MELDFGKKLLQDKKFDEAKSFFLKELEKDNKSFRLYFFLGLTFFELNDFEKSIFYYKKSLKNYPNSVSIMLNLANAQYTVGNFLAAKSLYLKIIKLDIYNPRAYYGLYSLNPSFLEESHYSIITEIKNKKKIDLYENSLIEFLISKKYKLENNKDLELIHLKNYHTLSFQSNLKLNLQGLFYYDKIIYKHFNKVNFITKSTNLNLKSFTNLYPIFIVGLPRSGSTLIESIISSAEVDIKSLGETSVINVSILEQIKDTIFKDNFEEKKFNFNLNLELLVESVYKKYNSYHQIPKTNFYFVDKSLENFFNVELILKIFPNAVFIHCKRNYKDAIISIYNSMLPFLPWTHKLENIIDYVDKYIKVTNFFEKKYPKNFLTVSLEELTNNQVDMTKKIFNFCNLEWSQKILKFYKRKNLNVKTLSNMQVRSEIFNYKKNKYASYLSLLNDFNKKFDWLN